MNAMPDDGQDAWAEAAISEQAVLGRAIMSAAGAAEALAVLAPEHFLFSAHRVVFEAAQRLADTGEPVDPTTVLAELARSGMLAKVGAAGQGTGGVFLASLMECAGDIGYHAPKVLARWRRDEIAAALRSGLQMTASPGWDPAVHPEHVRKLVEDATAHADTAVLRPNSEAVTEVLDSLGTRTDPGLPTGYADLDDAIGGLRPGEVVVVGARPGQGKTLIAGCIADYVATRLQMPVLFSSLEMTEEELTLRRIAAVAKVPLHDLVRRQVSETAWERIRRASDRLLSTRLYIDDTPHASIAHIRSRLRAMERAGDPARLLVIDYLGFMAAPRAESRQQAVAELARGVKTLAREREIPVLLLAQLNRSPEARSDKRPNPSDLRESGEIEQSADVVMLLHREAAYEPESPRAGEIDVLISKNRQGPQCVITLCFQGHYGRITGMARDDAPASEWTPAAVIGDAA